jgi:membrane protease YdiL (CAAX protease family)
MVTLGAVEALAFVVVTFAVLRVHASERAPAEACGVRATSSALVMLGLALGLLLHAPTASLSALVEKVNPTPSEMLALQAELFSARSMPQMIVLVLVAGCVVPLVEELFFRGALYGGLAREFSPRVAAIVSALCFAVSRPDARAWPALLLFASVVGYVRLRSGSLLPCIALHVGYAGAEVAAGLASIGGAAIGTDLRLQIFGWLGSFGLLFAVNYVSQNSDEASQARAQDET